MNEVALPKKRSLLEIVLTPIIVLIGGIAGWSLTQNVFDHSKDVSVQQQLVQYSNDYNKKLPTLIDEVTRLDTTKVGDRQLFLNYTLIGSIVDPVTPEKIQTLRAEMVVNYRTKPELQFFRDSGIRLTHTYYDSSGKYITEINIGPDDLK